MTDKILDLLKDFIAALGVVVIFWGLMVLFVAL